MDINDSIKNRTDLKSYFVKNAIPTESNFAELIESGLNQREDGLVKFAGAPLSVEASGDASSQKKAINLYADFADEKPHWVLSLNPRSDPTKAETARPGFSISDADGNSSLFVDRETGNVGVGTVAPTATLSVNGTIDYSTLTKLNVANSFSATIGCADLRIGHTARRGSAGRALVDGKSVLHLNYGPDWPKTQINSPLFINGFTESLGISVNNGLNSGVGRGVWFWKSGDSAHVIYSASPSGKSPANVPAVKGYFDAGHRLRLRTYYNGQGFLFENSKEQALVDIDANNGNIWTNGAVYCGGSDIYFTQTDHTHTGTGNTAGYAAIENAKNYDALMILGRAGTDKGRKVRLWDYLEVNGRLDVTGDLVGAAKNPAGQAQRVRCGQSSTSSWKVYSANGIYVDVNTSHAGFTSTPVYVASLAGNSNHWTTTGGSSIYTPTKTGFRIYVRLTSGGALAPAYAASKGWHITWVAIGN